MSVPNRNVHHRKSSARCDYAGQILLVLHFVFSRDNSVFFSSFQISPYVCYVYRVYCNPLASSSLSMLSFSAAASTTIASEFFEEETASEAACEEREQEGRSDESGEGESSSSENGDADHEHMQQV